MKADWDGYLRYRERFEEANDRDFYPIEWIDEQIRANRIWPIIGEHAALLMEIFAYPGGARVAHVRAAAGDLGEIAGSLATCAEYWARANGCTIAEIDGREGWARVMKDQGWKVHQLVLQKEL
jgi:hypothetical protein